MASLTIRQLDETIKQKLRLQAAQHGRSMEAEARSILNKLFTDQPTEGIATLIQNIVKKENLSRKETVLYQPERKAKVSHRQLDFNDEVYG